MMLPPPITIASCVPMVWASATWRAVDATIRGSMPNSWEGSANDSPDSFRRRRLNLGRDGTSSDTPRSAFADADATEATHRHVLAHRRLGFIEQQLDRLALVLDPFLIE